MKRGGVAWVAALRRRARARCWLALPLVLGGCRGPADPADYPAVATLARELAVAKRHAPASTPRAARCEAVAQREGSLYLPYGTELEVLADLPPRAALRLEGLARCGDRSRRGEIVPGAGPRAMRLPRRGGPARLRLAAHVPAARDGGAAGASSRAPAGGLLLRGLALGSRATPEGARPTPTSSGAAAALRQTLRGGRPNILVWLIDALRRDGLGCYGGPRGVSPHLDRLAREGTLFEDAMAQGSWTRPTVASLLTGVTPATHGVYTIHDALAERAQTLGEHLQGAGYRTVGLVANINVGPKMGFRQGFDRMRQLYGKRDTARELSAELQRWLVETREGGRPFFAYIHTIEPHSPYLPPEPFRSRFARGVPPELGTRKALRRLEARQTKATPRNAEQLRALYDAEVAANDAAFGALRAWLENQGLWRDTVVVVLADHGEEFHEHGGWEHGMKMHEETLAIPLLLRVPGHGEGRRVARLAQHVDLLPTLLELAGVPTPTGLDGASLLPSLAGAERTPPSPALSYQRFVEGVHEAAVTTAGYRLLVRTSAGGEPAVRLYDRRRDPRERRDLAKELPVTTAYLQSVLRWPRRDQPTLARPAGAMGVEVQKQLQALGYL